MKFRIDERIFDKYPDLVVGVVVALGINNGGTSEEIIQLIRSEEEKIRGSFDLNTLSDNPKIAAWRRAYSSFGAKPKKYRSSMENLYRMVLQGRNIRHINKLVDIYNYISLKYMVPVGGDDIDKVEGDIVLTFARGDERFVELNSREVKNPRPGEVIYRDNRDVLCRRWNWRESDKTKMTEETRNACLAVEGLPPVTKREIEVAVGELAELIKRFCGGRVEVFILDRNKPEAEILSNS